jgi:membrane fusion protein, multidrug efflux system
MKNYIILSISLLAFSCGQKKETLAEKKTKVATLKTQVRKLEEEIAKLEPKREDAKAINVSLATVQSQTFKHFIEMQGTLDSKDNVFVSPKTPGAIEHLYVKEGDYVRAGQVIARIDNSIMEVSLREINVQLETAKIFFEKQKSLWEQKIGTEVQFIQAKTQVEALEKRIDTMREQMKLSVVTTPISGQVDEVRQKAGEMAMPGMGIIRVANITNLKIKANVADTYAGTVKKGDVINVKIPDLNKELKAVINFVSTTVNPSSRTFEVHANLPKISSDMKPNMMAMLTINDQNKANSIVIKQNLIQTTEDGDVVYVAVTEGNKKIARSRLVKTGLTYNGDIIILEGLKAGDEIIVEGQQEVVDGIELKVK